MPPSERPIPRFAAEPPQQELPHGRWAEALSSHFLEASAAIETDIEIGEPHEIVWFPDRTFFGRTYIPATAATANGYELFGYVSYQEDGDSGSPVEFEAYADFTDDTAEANPDWKLDLSDCELARWRGLEGATGEMVLVWGLALLADGQVATAELGPTTTDQCRLTNDRFTLVSLDNYTGDLLEVKLFTGSGGELASESLYEET